MSEENVVELKLIGAETYVCRKAGVGVSHPAKAGDVCKVAPQFVEGLLEKIYAVGIHEYPVWSTDVNAQVRTKKTQMIPIGERRRMEQEDKDNAAKLAQAVADKEAAEEREADLQRRILALEEKMDGQAEADKPAPKKAARKKRTTKSAA